MKEKNLVYSKKEDLVFFGIEQRLLTVLLLVENFSLDRLSQSVKKALAISYVVEKQTNRGS